MYAAVTGLLFLGSRNKMENKKEIDVLGYKRISKLLLKFSIPCVMGLLISAFSDNDHLPCKNDRRIFSNPLESP
jgi:hypothetical protein